MGRTGSRATHTSPPRPRRPRIGEHVEREIHIDISWENENTDIDTPGEDAGELTEPSAEGWRFIGAAIGVIAISALGGETLPVLVGAMMDGLGLDAVQVGRIASVEMGAQALAALGLAPRIDRLDRRRLIVGAGCVALLAHAGSALGSSESALLALRALAGLAEGTALAVVNAALASSRNPDRTYATVALAGGILIAGLMGVMPLASDAWQHAGAFGLLAGVVLIALPVAARIPRGPRVRRSDAPSSERAAATRPGPVRLAATSMILAVFALGLGQNAIWAFAERIAAASGVAPARLGMVFVVGGGIGLLGSATAMVLGTRIGRTVPVLAGVLGTGASCALITYQLTPPSFIAGMLVYYFTFMFLYPYLLGLSAAVDPAGRVAAGVGGAGYLGAALGPVLGGALAREGFGALGVLAIGMTAVTLLLLLPTLAWLARRPSTAVSPESSDHSGD